METLKKSRIHGRFKMLIFPSEYNNCVRWTLGNKKGNSNFDGFPWRYFMMLYDGRLAMKRGTPIVHGCPSRVLFYDLCHDSVVKKADYKKFHSGFKQEFLALLERLILIFRSIAGRVRRRLGTLMPSIKRF